jgi:ammonium transporter, Amt family
MDVLAEHGIAGVVGLVFNAFFAADYIIGLDGVNNGITGGWINHNYKQMYIQIAYIVAACAWSFVVSAIIAFAINAIPGLKLRASEEAELLGMDDDQLGEFAYDYVEVRRDYLAWTPATEAEKTDSNINAEDRHGIPQHSQMIHGESPESSENGNAHTGIGGDRHGVAAEEKEKEQTGRSD